MDNIWTHLDWSIDFLNGEEVDAVIAGVYVVLRYWLSGTLLSTNWHLIYCHFPPCNLKVIWTILIRSSWGCNGVVVEIVMVSMCVCVCVHMISEDRQFLSNFIFQNSLCWSLAERTQEFFYWLQWARQTKQYPVVKHRVFPSSKSYNIAVFLTSSFFWQSEHNKLNFLHCLTGSDKRKADIEQVVDKNFLSWVGG